MIKYSQNRSKAGGGTLRNISDVIENYLKSIFELENNRIIEIKRNEIAQKFDCVPSQINYVINTRFTLESGYRVESKRGGGGFIRIIKVELIDELDLLDKILHLIGTEISHSQAEQVVLRLLEEKIITNREARIMLQGVHSINLIKQEDSTNQLRASILKAMITEFRYV